MLCRHKGDTPETWGQCQLEVDLGSESLPAASSHLEGTFEWNSRDVVMTCDTPNVEGRFNKYIVDDLMAKNCQPPAIPHLQNSMLFCSQTLSALFIYKYFGRVL